MALTTVQVQAADGDIYEVIGDLVGGIFYPIYKLAAGVEGDAGGLLSTPDPVSGAMVGITYPHHEIHEGDAFITDAVDESMANTDTLILAFRTPPTDSPRIHMVMSFAAKAAGHLDFIEGPTWTNQTGSQNPIYNRARFSSNTSDLREDQSSATFQATGNVILNPTGLAGGTVLESFYTWSDKKSTTQQRGQAEFVLNTDVQYVVRFTADEATNAGQIILDWYEHTDTN
jgi:hypothetical protein